MERNTTIAEVWIGNCEGNELKPMLMIELNKDEYEVEYKVRGYSVVYLTENGLNRFRGQYDSWDVDYYNYVIHAFIDDSDAQYKYETLLKCQAELTKKINLLGEWLGI